MDSNQKGIGNNPVVLVDKDGKLSDWFYNEKSGDVYYNNTYGKNDVGKITGSDWKYLGANGMFNGNSKMMTDERVIMNSGIFGKGDLFKYNDQTKLMSSNMMFSDGFGQKFMDKMGYDFNPKLAKVHFSKTTTFLVDGDKPVLLTSSNKFIENVITWQYNKKGLKEYTVNMGDYMEKDWRFTNYWPLTSQEDNWSITEFRYEKSTLGSSGILDMILNFLSW